MSSLEARRKRDFSTFSEKIADNSSEGIATDVSAASASASVTERAIENVNELDQVAKQKKIAAAYRTILEVLSAAYTNRSCTTVILPSV